MVQSNALTQTESSHQYLTFYLGEKDAAGIPVTAIVETFFLSWKEVLPVPKMPTWVLGIYNWRGEMLWIVDLEGLLGYTLETSVVDSTLNPMVIVIQQEDKTLGLVVNKVTDIESIPESEHKPPTPELFNPDLIPLLNSYTIDKNQRVLIQLSPEAILHFSCLSSG